MTEPRSTERPRRRAELPLITLLPNLVTVAAICAGLSAIRFAIEGNTLGAVQLILVAGLFDGLDGRLARMLKSETPLGAELDSLADFLNFGVAPGILLYTWAFGDLRNEGWIAVVIYVVCCVMRLARFNVGNKAETAGASKRFFTGVPAPAGAFLAMLPVFVSFTWSRVPLVPEPVIALYMVAVGLLMISRIPTWSLKSLTIYRENARVFLVGFVAVLAALLSFPWISLSILCLAYFAGMAWSWRVAKSIR
ncbi:CDP-diacylglycerol--serine O-phosphatidyltransferase [Acidimangrovimonas sediminis]|uniref:CDP-diacylglycerol--serine O-phosphatidyltransferase n=1 Tax=Acidimangrovimonas sediminis TaxID=2056283 RepID=UPI002FCE309A